MKKLILMTQLCTLLLFATTTQAAPYQKPGASIWLAEPLSVQLDPFTKKSVTIDFGSGSKGLLSMEALTEDGISIVSDITHWTFDLSQDTPQVTLDIEANEVGRYNIMFHAKIAEGDNASNRVFGISVLVGDEATLKAKAKQKPKKDAVVMKAEETITQH